MPLPSRTPGDRSTARCEDRVPLPEPDADPDDPVTSCSPPLALRPYKRNVLKPRCAVGTGYTFGFA